MLHIRNYCFTLLLIGFGLTKLQAQSGTRMNTITDINGNIYKTIRIGSQVWMAENLKTTRYTNGDRIGTTYPDTISIRGENAPKYQWAYAGNDSILAVYGRLYTWYTVSDKRNICPGGWHVSTEAEWQTLTKFLGGDSIAQGKLKEAGTNHWNKPNNGATNESGFTALPGGNRWDYGRFLGVGEFTHWWTSTEYKPDTCLAWRRLLYSNKTVKNYRGAADKKLGWYVRCVKD
jgi:uncharacterized protein (TIGR02145 family)